MSSLPQGRCFAVTALLLAAACAHPPPPAPPPAPPPDPALVAGAQQTLKEALASGKASKVTRLFDPALAGVRSWTSETVPRALDAWEVSLTPAAGQRRSGGRPHASAHRPPARRRWRRRVEEPRLGDPRSRHDLAVRPAVAGHPAAAARRQLEAGHRLRAHGAAPPPRERLPGDPAAAIRGRAGGAGGSPAPAGGPSDPGRPDERRGAAGRYPHPPAHQFPERGHRAGVVRRRPVRHPCRPAAHRAGTHQAAPGGHVLLRPGGPAGEVGVRHRQRFRRVSPGALVPGPARSAARRGPRPPPGSRLLCLPALRRPRDQPRAGAARSRQDPALAGPPGADAARAPARKGVLVPAPDPRPGPVPQVQPLPGPRSVPGNDRQAAGHPRPRRHRTGGHRPARQRGRRQHGGRTAAGGAGGTTGPGQPEGQRRHQARGALRDRRADRAANLRFRHVDRHPPAQPAGCHPDGRAHLGQAQLAWRGSNRAAAGLRPGAAVLDEELAARSRQRPARVDAGRDRGRESRRPLRPPGRGAGCRPGFQPAADTGAQVADGPVERCRHGHRSP